MVDIGHRLAPRGFDRLSFGRVAGVATDGRPALHRVLVVPDLVLGIPSRALQCERTDVNRIHAVKEERFSHVRLRLVMSGTGRGTRATHSDPHAVLAR